MALRLCAPPYARGCSSPLDGESAVHPVGGVRLFVAEYAIVTLLAEPGSVPSVLPGGEALAWVSSWLWVPHIGLFVFLALLFPDGRPPSLAALRVARRGGGCGGGRRSSSMAGDGCRVRPQQAPCRYRGCN